MSHLNNLTKIQLIARVLYLENQEKNDLRYLADKIIQMTTLERVELLHEIQQAGICTNCAREMEDGICWDCYDNRECL